MLSSRGLACPWPNRIRRLVDGLFRKLTKPILLDPVALARWIRMPPSWNGHALLAHAVGQQNVTFIRTLFAIWHEIGDGRRDRGMYIRVRQAPARKPRAAVHGDPQG
jgi:hypothetical protein